MKLFRMLKFHWLFALFTVGYFFLVLNFIQDFGLSNNEIYFYNRGHDLVKYYLYGDMSVNLTTLSDPHNYIYSAAAFILNKSKNYITYHIFNSILFFSVLCGSYLLLQHKYKNPILSVIPALFMLLTPRLIGHSINNPHTIFAMFTFFFAILSIYGTSKLRGTYYKIFLVRVVLTGISFGIAQGASLYAFLLYIFYLSFNTYLIFTRHDETKSKTKFSLIGKMLIELVFISFIANLILIGTWPFIAANPLINLFHLINDKFTLNSAFANNGFYTAAALKYVFTYFLITTPIQIIIFLLFSIIFVIKKHKDDLYILCLQILGFFFLFYVFVPVNSAPEITEILFLYPFIYLVASIVFIEIVMGVKSANTRNIITGTVLISFCFTTYSLVKLHPYEYIFYNKAIGGLKKASVLYEKDYLKLAYTEAFKKIARENRSLADVYSCEKFLYGMPQISFVKDAEHADYFVCEEPIFNIKPTDVIEREGVPLVYITKISK